MAKRSRKRSLRGLSGAGRRDARVVCDGGAGGFLDPPEYPTHKCRVETDLRRRPENRGSMSLLFACGKNGREWLDKTTVKTACSKLRAWHRSRPKEPPVLWRRQVLGYFANMYRNPSAGQEQWYASKMDVDRKRDPLENASDHAGVHFVRKFWPGWRPSREDFDKAKWGD